MTKEEYAVYADFFESAYKENFKLNEYKTFFVILDDVLKPNFITLEKYLNHISVSDYLYKTNPSTELTPSTFEICWKILRKIINTRQS